jgi:Tol biopolymer transport system component
MRKPHNTIVLSLQGPKNPCSTFSRRGVMRGLVFLIPLACGLLAGCSRNAGCIIDYLMPVSPYTDPVWYPDGSMLGFNHIPLRSVIKSSHEDCPTSYSYTYFNDSVGFWLVNRDGSNMRRLTNFELANPSWSPDGKWIAFQYGKQIYKMPFYGAGFDTTKITQLTNVPGSHFYPTWSNTGDTIYFDSDEDNVGHPYHVFKMAADGSGHVNIGTGIPDSIYSREPFCTDANQILHIRGDSVSTHIYTMDGNGNHVKQVTFNISPHIYIKNPFSYGNKVYYEDFGIWSANMDGSALQMIAPFSNYGFSIAKDGTIAYINLDISDNSTNSSLDSTHGVIWVMKPDGSNNKQLTFNHNF